MNDQLLCHVDMQTEQRLIEVIASRCDADWVVDVHTFTPQLVHLLVASRHQPMRACESTIRQIVVDYTFAQETREHESEIDHRVRTIVEAMEHIRREQFQNGQWSNAPVPPMMFG